MKKSLSSSSLGSILLRRSARQSPPLEANVNWNVLRRKLLVVTVTCNNTTQKDFEYAAESARYMILMLSWIPSRIACLRRGGGNGAAGEQAGLARDAITVRWGLER